MATDKKLFNPLLALLLGIFGWLFAWLAQGTGIFPWENLPEIGLFLGVLIGGFKEKLEEILL